MKIFVLILLSFGMLQAIDGMKNVTLNTMDTSEVQEKISQRLERLNLKKLPLNVDYKSDLQKIKNLQEGIKDVVSLKKDIKTLNDILSNDISEYNKAQERYTTKMAKLYTSNNNLKRTLYYVVAHKLDEEYMQELKNVLVDTYAVKKFDQSTEIKESQEGIVAYKNVVTTNKYFGQMQIDTLEDITYRDKNLNIKILKVVQYPFVKSKESSYNKSFSKNIDRFEDDSSLTLKEIKNMSDVQMDFLDTLPLDVKDKEIIASTIQSEIPVQKIENNLNKKAKKIQKVLQKIEKAHDKYIAKLNSLSLEINAKTSQLKDKLALLHSKTQEIQKIARDYSIELKEDDLYKLIIWTPKLYSEVVALDEEKEFIMRKIKSYFSKINIAELQQSETLTNYYDLETKNLQKQKLIEYESIHFLPFVKGRELATFVFGVIKLEDKVSESDLIKRELKYTDIEFVPVKKAYSTIFAATSEVNLGIVKEFLESHRVNKYFDKYCLTDSTLPDEVKNLKQIEEEFYNYPAVCFKPEKLDEFMQWLGKTTSKNLKFPTSQEWSYVASNANSSEYCWGNESVEELNEDGRKPENIYYEDGEDTYLEPVKSFEKSMIGVYDMCGNAHELVKDDGEFMIKGNSYISYIESSDAPPLEYDEGLNPMLGIRAFYITEQ